MAKQRTFKIITLSVGGKGNKIYKSGDVVKESHFPNGIIDELIKGKFIEETDSEEEEVKVPVMQSAAQTNADNSSEEAEEEVETIDHIVTEQDLINHPELTENGVKVDEVIKIPMHAKDAYGKPAPSVNELPDGVLKIFENKHGEKREIKSMEDITKPELIYILGKEKINFSAKSGRKVLFDTWIAGK